MLQVTSKFPFSPGFTTTVSSCLVGSNVQPNRHSRRERFPFRPAKPAATAGAKPGCFYLKCQRLASYPLKYFIILRHQHYHHWLLSSDGRWGRRKEQTAAVAISSCWKHSGTTSSATAICCSSGSINVRSAGSHHHIRCDAQYSVPGYSTVPDSRWSATAVGTCPAGLQCSCSCGSRTAVSDRILP